MAKPGLVNGNVNTGVSKWQSDLRAAMFDGITAGDVKAIVTRMVTNAKNGDPAAIKMVFDYVLGGAKQRSE